MELDISFNDRLVDLADEGFEAAVRSARMENSTLEVRRMAGTRISGRAIRTTAVGNVKPNNKKPGREGSDHSTGRRWVELGGEVMTSSLVEKTTQVHGEFLRVVEREKVIAVLGFRIDVERRLRDDRIHPLLAV